jgi:hypothetical protein
LKNWVLDRAQARPGGGPVSRAAMENEMEYGSGG